MTDELPPPNFGEGRLRVVHSPVCAHYFVQLNSNDETVRCRVCKANIRPFAVLIGLAREWDWATHYEQKSILAKERLELLEAEEKRVKSRLKNATKGEGAHPRADEFVQTALSMLNAVSTREELRAYDSFAARFNWLAPGQASKINDAYVIATRRIELKRVEVNRTVRLIPGGKTIPKIVRRKPMKDPTIL